MLLVIREALRTIRRMPLTWAMSVLTLAVTLGVGGLFALLALRAHSELSKLRSSLSIEAFFDPALSTEETTSITDRDIRGIPQISTVSFTSKEQALQEFAKSSGENVQEVLGVNPLPASVTVRLKEPSPANARSVEQTLRSLNGISEVKTDLSLLSDMESRAKGFDRITVIIGGLLVICAICFLITLSRLAIASRRDAIRAMSLMGASRSLLTTPFAIEGALAGLVGGILGSALLLLIQQQAFSAIGGGFTLVSSQHEILKLFCAIGAVGLILGGLVSWLFAMGGLRRLS